MGKYSESLGVWKHKIGNVEHELTPKMGDNDKVGSVIANYQKNKDTVTFLKNIRNLYYEFVLRDYPTLTDEDKDELKLLVEKNQVKISEDILVAFGWQSEEDLKLAKEKGAELTKNLM